MKLTDLTISNESLGNIYIAVGITPVYDYVNQKKTEKIIAQKVTIVLPQKTYEKVDVKIPTDGIKGELVMNKEVVFEELELYLYWYAGEYRLGARARSVQNKLRKALPHEQHAPQ